MEFYRRAQPAPLPNGHTFHVRLEDGSSLKVWTSSKALTVSHHRRVGSEPEWTAFFLLDEYPQLAQLYHPVLGWDIVRLIGLFRSEIQDMAQLNLRDPELRKEAGLETVSIPSHNRSKQEKRSLGQALELIAAYVDEHPGCTRLEIARGLGRAKSPHILAQIEWLVAQKVILRDQVIRANGVIEYRYRSA